MHSGPERQAGKEKSSRGLRPTSFPSFASVPKNRSFASHQGNKGNEAVGPEIHARKGNKTLDRGLLGFNGLAF